MLFLGGVGGTVAGAKAQWQIDTKLGNYVVAPNRNFTMQKLNRNCCKLLAIPVVFGAMIGPSTTFSTEIKLQGIKLAM